MLPQLTVTLLIPTFFFGALLAGAAAGYRREGLWLREGCMTLRRQQGSTCTASVCFTRMSA